MRPTIDDQLAGAERLLEGVAADPGLSEASRDLLTNARRLVRRADRASSGTWAFLAEDAGQVQRLLAELGPQVPALADEIGAACAEDVPVVPDLDALAGRHEDLRELLARAVRELPPDGDGDAARARVAARLRERVDTDPT